jgi:ribonuclease G
MVSEAGDEAPEAYLLRINPKVTAWFIADGARELHALEAETGRFFHFEGSDGLPLDHFAVTMEGTRAEIEEHAVPFRAGEEVHVHLVEPHMYNDDDAVAKVDGYLIDVVNGVTFVGEKKLVRIEEAGRTIARAVLTGADAETAEAAAKDRAAARERALASARRSASAKRGASKRREAAETLADEAPVEAGTAPAALAEADEAPRKRARRRRRSEDADTIEVGAEEVEEAPKPKGRARKRTAEDEEAMPPKPKGRARKRAAAGEEIPAEEAVEARAEVAEEPAKPARKRRAKPAPEPEPEAVDAEGEDEDEDGDALSSRPRRRGRRGGRRRSRAKTPEISD